MREFNDIKHIKILLDDKKKFKKKFLNAFAN